MQQESHFRQSLLILGHPYISCLHSDHSGSILIVSSQNGAERSNPGSSINFETILGRFHIDAAFWSHSW